MKNAKLVSISLGFHLKLWKDLSPTSNEEKKKMHGILYSRVIGNLMYAMVCGRPDLADAFALLVEICLTQTKDIGKL